MSGFHGNKIVQRMVDDLIKNAGVTAFVETGTHYGATTKHVAGHHPDLPIFTCEIKEEYFLEARKRMKVFANVNVFQESSEKFIARLAAEGEIGNLPMFFLDAHWYDYWPLEDEAKAIASLPRFIMLIDDFGVPGQPQFETDAGGGGTIGEHRTKPDKRPCDMTLVGSHLPDDCLVGYPNYGKQEAYGRQVPHLRGHAFIVRGIDAPLPAKDVGFYDWGAKR